MLYVEHGIALQTMQVNQASSHGEGKSHDFSRVAAGTWGFLSSYDRNGPSKFVFVQRLQDSCLVVRNTSGFFSQLGSAIGMPLEVRSETQGPFPVATGILGFLSIFKWSQASSPFEALKSVFLLSCQRSLKPVEKRLGTRVFPRVSTGDSDIPSCYEMKDKPALKSVQGNQALFPVRASRCPFHLRQQTQHLFHIYIADRSLLLRCEWKVGIPLEVKQGNRPSSRDDLGNMELFPVVAVISRYL